MIKIINLIAPLCDSVNYGNIIQLAILGQDLDLVKEFGEKLEDKSKLSMYQNYLYNPIYDAIRLKNVEILKYLVSITKVIHNSKEKFLSSTPIHGIVQKCTFNFHEIHQCIEMVKLVLPKIEDINGTNWHGETLLDEIIREFWFYSKKKCILDIVKLIAPVIKINKDVKNYPPQIYEILKPYAKRKHEEEIETLSVVTSKKNQDYSKIRETEFNLKFVP